jgi:hypothetical protein
MPQNADFLALFDLKTGFHALAGQKVNFHINFVKL